MRLIFLAMLFGCLAMPVAAKSLHREQVVTYPVTGKTAKEINDDIKKGGRRIGQSVPYAFTAIATKTTTALDESGDDCRYKTYRISALYTYFLPKLTSTKGVAPTTLANWKSLTASLKTHEQLHRANWQTCFKEFEADATEIVARTCEALPKKVAKALTQKKLACLKNDHKLDDGYGRELWQHPFVKEAMGGKGKSSTSFSLFGRKKKQSEEID